MNYYQRPLRSDELMHGHKYIDKVRTKSGAWRYIYDLAGGKYKKEAADHKQKSREDRNASKNYEKWAKQDYNDSKINRDSARAYDKASDKELLKGIASGEKYSDQPHTKRSVELANKSLHRDISGKIAYDSSRLMYRKSLDRIESARKHDNAAKTANEKYRNSLAGKYDAQKVDPNSTLNRAKKSINRGKNFFKKLFG